MKKNVAIIGANGQIGMVLCREWLRSPTIWPVAIVRNRLAESFLRIRLGAELEIRRGSVADSQEPSRLLDGCEAVVNCAYASSGGFRASRLANEATISAILGVRDVRRLVQLSSVAVYGVSRNGSSTFERPKPTSSYGREKLAHEVFAVAAAKNALNRLAVLRVGHVYGAEQVMSRFILQSISDPRFRLPELRGEGANCVSLQSLVEGIRRAVLDECASGVFNLVDNPNKSWTEIFSWHSDSVAMRLPERLTLEQTEAAAAAALAPVGDGFLDIGRATINALRPVGLGQFAANPAVRARIDGLFSSSPAYLEAAARKLHVRRSVTAQLARIDAAFADLPYWLFLNPVPGVNIAPAGKVPAEQDSRLLRAWWRRISDPRPHD